MPRSPSRCSRICLRRIWRFSSDFEALIRTSILSMVRSASRMRSTDSRSRSTRRRLTGSANSMRWMDSDMRTRRRASFHLALMYLGSRLPISRNFSRYFRYSACASATLVVSLSVSLILLAIFSSVTSSSLKITTSRTVSSPAPRRSARRATSCAAMGVRVMMRITAFLPRSMRLAISTSPSRVSSGTVPISRRYMRTGSFVLSRVPGVRSSSAPSSPSLASRNFCSESTTSIPIWPNIEKMSSSSSEDVISDGNISFTSS